MEAQLSSIVTQINFRALDSKDKWTAYKFSTSFHNVLAVERSLNGCQAAQVDGRPIASSQYEPIEHKPMYKGGFLMPKEIRIRMNRGERSLKPTSVNVARRMSVEPKRFETVIFDN